MTENDNHEKEEISNENLNSEENELPNSEENSLEEEKTELSEVDLLKKEILEQKDKYLRMYAEFENFRRRTSKERIDLIQSASEGLLKELLPVVDDFERANKSMETSSDIAAVKEGISLVYNKFFKILSDKGVKPMESKDQDFDVELHECITQFAAGDDKKGKVIDEVEKGYYLYDKVIRYAKVVVGN